MTSSIRVAIVTPFFPTPADSVTGSFVLDHARALAGRGLEVEVRAPVPWAPWPLSRLPRFSPYAAVPTRQTFDELVAHRPRYLRPPGRWFRSLAGRSMASSLKLALDESCDVIVAHTVLPGGHAAMSSAPSTPLITVTHGSDLLQHARESAATRRVARRVLQHSTEVVAVSLALADSVLALDETVSVSTVANGVDTERFVPLEPGRRGEARAARGLDERPVLLFVGLDTHRKGLDLLLEACRLLSSRGVDHQLVIVGAEGVDDATTRWLGRVPREEVPVWTALADIAALPSREEAFGISLLEAGSCGVPCVGSRVQGIAEVIVDQETGLLVPPEDVGALAAALERLLQDSTLRRTLGDAARRRVETRFSWGRHAEKMERIVRRALSRRGRVETTDSRRAPS